MSGRRARPLCAPGVWSLLGPQVLGPGQEDAGKKTPSFARSSTAPPPGRPEAALSQRLALPPPAEKPLLR